MKKTDHGDISWMLTQLPADWQPAVSDRYSPELAAALADLANSGSTFDGQLFELSQFLVLGVLPLMTACSSSHQLERVAPTSQALTGAALQCQMSYRAFNTAFQARQWTGVKFHGAEMDKVCQD
jgi:hypothetical protein